MMNFILTIIITNDVLQKMTISIRYFFKVIPKIVVFQHLALTSLIKKVTSLYFIHIQLSHKEININIYFFHLMRLRRIATFFVEDINPFYYN